MTRAPSNRAAAGNALSTMSEGSLRAEADSHSGRMAVITSRFVAVAVFILPIPSGGREVLLVIL